MYIFIFFLSAVSLNISTFSRLWERGFSINKLIPLSAKKTAVSICLEVSLAMIAKSISLLELNDGRLSWDTGRLFNSLVNSILFSLPNFSKHSSFFVQTTMLSIFSIARRLLICLLPIEPHPTTNTLITTYSFLFCYLCICCLLPCCPSTIDDKVLPCYIRRSIRCKKDCGAHNFVRHPHSS